MSSDGHCSSLLRLVAELEEPVARLGVTGWGVERLRALLERAEPRAWRVETFERPMVVAARCPVDGMRAVVTWARPPCVAPVSGGYLVSRSLPVAPGRWLLLGRPTVVSGPSVAGFERLLDSLRAPRGEFWRVHGGVLARAARHSLSAEVFRGESRAA